MSVHIYFYPLQVTIPFHTRETDQTENDQDTSGIEVEDVQLSDIQVMTIPMAVTILMTIWC